jgi:signal transduction histidine kinase
MRSAACGATFGNVRRQFPLPLAGRIRQVRAVTARRQVHWIAVDCVTAAALLSIEVGHAAGLQPQFGVPAWLAVTANGATAVPIAVRRVQPAAVFTIVLAANTLAVVSGVSGNPAITVALALYTLAVSRPPRWSVAALAAALTLTLPAEMAEGLAARPPLPRPVLEYLVTASTVTIAAAWALGAVQRRYAARSAGEHARRAVTDERLRIARELHDVISNAVTLMTAKAAVTGYLLDSHPEDARSALAVIEETGRGALAEMRLLLGVLRTDEGSPQAAGRTADETASRDPGARAPAPGLAGVRALAAQATAAGVHTTVDIRGQRELPDAMALSVYRIVQEALANVIKHAAPARCTVQIDLTGGHTTVEITDDGHPRPAPAAGTGGHGLPGMRERVGLYGGEFAAGPRPEGGFRVTARLPAGSSADGTVTAGRRRPA